MKKNALLLSFLFIIFQANATTYLPIDIEQQLKESSGVVHAVNVGREYKKDSKGNVVTENIFQVIKSAGLKNSEIINKNDFSVIVPGGKWQDITYHVHGAPLFSKGEEVILLVKRGGEGFSLTNLALGKYEIIRDLNSVYIKSSVFPAHKKLGRIDFRQFSYMVSSLFGEGFERVYKDTYVYRPRDKKENGRMPASVRGPEGGDVESEFSIFWLVICFSLLGVYSLVGLRGRSGHDR